MQKVNILISNFNHPPKKGSSISISFFSQFSQVQFSMNRFNFISDKADICFCLSDKPMASRECPGERRTKETRQPASLPAPGPVHPPKQNCSISTSICFLFFNFRKFRFSMNRTNMLALAGFSFANPLHHSSISVLIVVDPKKLPAHLYF